MTREQLDDLMADVMAEHFARLEADLNARVASAVAAKPVPPFVPPPPWVAGNHSAGAVVRHRNGIFSARFANSDEPPSDAWLPLLVGVHLVELGWNGDRAVAIDIHLSDGTRIATEREFALPIVRGPWDAEASYREGDRVFRFGEWHAVKESHGLDPSTPEAEGTWLKVSGKAARPVFKLDDDGTMFENGRAIGTVKPVVVTVLTELAKARG